MPEALEETDDDREEREDKVDTSETIESGDEAEELERAKDDRRTAAGKPSNDWVLGQKDIGGR
jgi:hypothetical protein